MSPSHKHSSKIYYIKNSKKGKIQIGEIDTKIKIENRFEMDFMYGVDIWDYMDNTFGMRLEKVRAPRSVTLILSETPPSQ